MLLTDVKPYDSDVLNLSISTKTYWWHQLSSNGGNLFVHLIIVKKLKSFCEKLTLSTLPGFEPGFFDCRSTATQASDISSTGNFISPNGIAIRHSIFSIRMVELFNLFHCLLYQHTSLGIRYFTFPTSVLAISNS